MSSTQSKQSLGTWFLFVAITAANLFILQLYWKTLVSDRNLLEQDFLGYYTAASLPRSSMYDINRQRDLQTNLLGKPYGVPAGVLLFNHPPFLVPIVKLLVSADYVESYRRWATVLFVVASACAVIIYFLLRDAGHNVLISGLSAFTALLFYPSYRSIEIGTDTIVALLGVLLWALFLIRKKESAAGLALSLTVIKPHLALVLAAATLARTRRGFLAFVIGGAVITAFSIFYVGTKGVHDLVENIKFSADGEALGVFFLKQYNFMGLLARFAISKAVVTIAGWFAFFLVIVLLALYRRSIAIDLWVALAVCVAIFFSPNLHFHDIALLLLPMTIVARRVKQEVVPLTFFPLSPLLILAVGLTVASYSMQAITAAVIGRYWHHRHRQGDFDYGST